MMVPMTYQWDRLAAAIRDRRHELGLTQAQVARAAHVTPMTVRNLETARGYSRMPPSLIAIQAVLRWAPGSAETILEGGNPTPLSDAGSGTSTQATQAPDSEPKPPSNAADGEGLIPVTRLEVPGGVEYVIVLDAERGYVAGLPAGTTHITVAERDALWRFAEARDKRGTNQDPDGHADESGQ